MGAGGHAAPTERVADCVLPPAEAEMTGAKARPLLSRYFGLVQTVMVALVCPAGTVTLACTAASAVMELASATACPPAVVAELSVIVPVEVAPLPPATLDGLSVTDATVGPLTACAKRPVPSPTPAPQPQTSSENGSTQEPLRARFAMTPSLTLSLTTIQGTAADEVNGRGRARWKQRRLKRAS
jgi:hypothetical protein